MTGDRYTSRVGGQQPFLMTDEQAQDFSDGLQLVRQGTAEKLGHGFDVRAQMQTATNGQLQGVVAVSYPGVGQLTFNIEPEEEMFEDGAPLSGTDRDEITRDIAAAVAAEFLQATSPENMPAN